MRLRSLTLGVTLLVRTELLVGAQQWLAATRTVLLPLRLKMSRTEFPLKACRLIMMVWWRLPSVLVMTLVVEVALWLIMIMTGVLLSRLLGCVDRSLATFVTCLWARMTVLVLRKVLVAVIVVLIMLLGPLWRLSIRLVTGRFVRCVSFCRCVCILVVALVRNLVTCRWVHFGLS